MRDPVGTALFFGAALAFIVGIVLSAILWIRYRQPDTPLWAVFMSSFFVASPSYFHPEGEVLRRWAVGAFGLGVSCLLVIWHSFRGE